MDYLTKPLSRNDIRKLSLIMRQVFSVPLCGRFPVLDVLDLVPEKYNANYKVVEDDCMPYNTKARCIMNFDGSYTIEIKESVYDLAYNGSSANLGFICHELCHLFLMDIGYKPIFEKSFNDKQIRAFESVEWQAKALCQEVMIPYSETKDMTLTEIIAKYQVSKSMARYRIKLK